MCYRNNKRREQYLDNNFDMLTSVSIKLFMENKKINTPKEVWLNDIKEILNTEYIDLLHSSENNFKKILDMKYMDCLISQENINIYPATHMDLVIDAMMFLCIWKTPEDSEFVITDNSFGIFEGCQPGVYYHKFYVITPNIVIVLSNKAFHKDGQILGLLKKYYEMGFTKTLFEQCLHDIPTVKYKKEPIFAYETNNIKIKDSSNSFDINDEFTYKIRRISKETVNLINCILLDHANDYITFKSEKNLYKTIKYYNKIKKIKINNIKKENLNSMKLGSKINSPHTLRIKYKYDINVILEFVKKIHQQQKRC